jgi:hypothetical protein
MVINMDETKLRTIAQLQEFLDATPEVSFTGTAGDGDTQRYEHISRVLKRFDYPQRSKRDRGVVLAYLLRTSGYSRPQVTRLVARWIDNRLASVPLAKRYRAPVALFARKYTPSDIELLVEMDRANEDVCRFCRRASAAACLCRVWRSPLRAPGRPVGIPPLQPAQKHRLPNPAHPLHQDPPPYATPLACARHPGPMDVRAGCALTACTKGIGHLQGGHNA